MLMEGVIGVEAFQETHLILVPYIYGSAHRENSPITQTTPEPTLPSWGGWPREKFPPTPGHTASPVLSR